MTSERKNMEFTYQGQNYWLKSTGELYLRGKRVCCGYQWKRVDSADLLIELKDYVKTMEDGNVL
jgi:hypothetical protein